MADQRQNAFPAVVLTFASTAEKESSVGSVVVELCVFTAGSRPNAKSAEAQASAGMENIRVNAESVVEAAFVCTTRSGPHAENVGVAHSVNTVGQNTGVLNVSAPSSECFLSVKHNCCVQSHSGTARSSVFMCFFEVERI
mmetsp:Transcript_18142/g.28107  ORF Transcript_18142/g.28107 Transcript_18142/m.28107 type:complete len:140 (+) Transcript_18142:1396-1815(+)